MRDLYNLSHYDNRRSAVFLWLAAVETLRIQNKVEGCRRDVARAVVYYVRCACEMRAQIRQAQRAHKARRITSEEMHLRADNAAAVFEGALDLYRPKRERSKASDEYAWDSLRHIQAAYGIESPEYHVSQQAAYRLIQYHDECRSWEQGDYSRHLPPRRSYISDTPDQNNVQANFQVLFGESVSGGQVH